MQQFNNFIERYKYAILAALGSYVVIFIYLNVQTVTQYYPIKFELDGSRVEIPEEEIELKPENIVLTPPPPTSGEVKNLSRDVNDKREKSFTDYDEDKSQSKSQSLDEDVKSFEKKLFEEAGGYKQREKIKQELADRKQTDQTNKSKGKQDPQNVSGGDKQYAGSVMVDWSLNDRSPHQNKNWYVRNPGYKCGYGSSGRVMIRIRVNQDGKVVSATYDAASSSGANACMIQEAKEYAKISRFNYSGAAPSSQEGYILYTFVPQ